MTEEEFIEKYDSGEPFTVSELKDIINTLPNVTNEFVTINIFSASGRNFALPYKQEFLTYTVEGYAEQPYEVHKITTTVTKNTFVRKEED